MQREHNPIQFISWSAFIGMMAIGIVAGINSGFTNPFPGRVNFISPIEFIILLVPVIIIPLIISYSTISRKINGIVIGTIIVVPLIMCLIGYLWLDSYMDKIERESFSFIKNAF